MPRSTWKGFLRLSLVSVPVRAYTVSAAGGGVISLNQLHASCHSRIRYRKTCPIHGEVPNDEIVSGYDRLGRWRAAGAAQASLVLADAPRRLLVRLPDGRLAEPNGQLQFPFVDDGPATERPVVSFCDGDAWRRFGEELARMERWNEAASAFREALRLARDDTDLHFQLAYALQQAGRDSEAVDAYRSVLRLNPADGEAWNNLGAALLSLGHTHEAARSFRRAVTFLPDCAVARENLERVLKR